MLTEQSLLLARAEQGAIQINKTLIDMKTLLADAAEDFQMMAQEQGREISVIASSAPVKADAKLMRQVLYSLLTNSLRHGSGRVSVRLREVQSGFSLLIVNAVSVDIPKKVGLGLGSRVVGALVGLHDNIRLRTLQRKNSYAARLFFRANAS
jgi:signal transduction histidine kinase